MEQTDAGTGFRHALLAQAPSHREPGRPKAGRRCGDEATKSPAAGREPCGPLRRPRRVPLGSGAGVARGVKGLGRCACWRDIGRIVGEGCVVGGSLCRERLGRHVGFAGFGEGPPSSRHACPSDLQLTDRRQKHYATVSAIGRNAAQQTRRPANPTARPVHCPACPARTDPTRRRRDTRRGTREEKSCAARGAAQARDAAQRRRTRIRLSARRRVPAPFSRRLLPPALDGAGASPPPKAVGRRQQNRPQRSAASLTAGSRSRRESAARPASAPPATAPRPRRCCPAPLAARDAMYWGRCVFGGGGWVADLVPGGEGQVLGLEAVVDGGDERHHVRVKVRAARPDAQIPYYIYIYIYIYIMQRCVLRYCAACMRFTEKDSPR